MRERLEADVTGLRRVRLFIFAQTTLLAVQAMALTNCGDAGSEQPTVLCEKDSDCFPEQQCKLVLRDNQEDLAPAMLRCGTPSGDLPPGERCDSASQCAHSLCVVAGTCVQPCSNSCADDERCAEVFVRSEGEQTRRASACIPHAQLPPDGSTLRYVATAQPILLEPVVTNGVYVLQAPPGTTLLPTRLRTRSEPTTLLFDDTLTALGAEPPANYIHNRIFPFERTDIYPTFPPSTILLPASPSVANALDDTGYELDVMGLQTGVALEITRIQNSNSGDLLDLDVFLVGIEGLNASNTADLDEAFELVEGIYAGAGVSFGQIRYHELRGGLRDRFTHIDRIFLGEGVDELPELFALSGGVFSASVALFFVQTIDGSLLGFSGGTPGPLGVAGTGASGVAFAWNAIEGSGFSLHSVIAHELGHFLGLTHTTEATGLVLEALDDTPQCSLAADSNSDGLLTPQECGTLGGANNLMFYNPQGVVLSSEQHEIVRRAQILRPQR